MAASSSTTRNSNNTAARMLRYTVIMACITSQLLSVDAIRCHQCNSHLNEDCIALRLNTPRAPRDDQYLKECEGEHRATAFCRKTVLTIQITGERRIVRGCGWIYDQSQVQNNSCFNADNEGYLQTICTCDTDGCNAAPAPAHGVHWVVWSASAMIFVFAVLLRKND